MSAKQAVRRPPIPIDMLLDDILCEVFRHATWVPYGIELWDLPVDAIKSTQWRESVRAHRSSIVTKRYLVRVCRSWYRLASLYFYEWITVWKLKSLPALISSLERFIPGDHTHSEYKPTYGWSTKRLDLILRDYAWALPGIDVQSCLYRLLRNLPHLEFLAIHTNHVAGEFVNILTKPFCPNLQVLKWNGLGVRPHRENWNTFCSNHLQLRAINPTFDFEPDVLTTYPTQLGRGPYPYIKVYSSDHRDPPIALPYTSLEHLIWVFAGTPDEWGPTEIWHRWVPTFFQPNLRVFQLNGHFLGWDDFTHLMSLFHPFWKLAPNLEHFIMAFGRWPYEDWNGSVARLPSTVKKFSICSFHGIPKKADVALLMTSLSDLVRTHKGLVVQIMDRTLMGRIMEYWDYLRRIYTYHERNVLLKWLDPEGREVRLFTESDDIEMRMEDDNEEEEEGEDEEFRERDEDDGYSDEDMEI